MAKKVTERSKWEAKFVKKLTPFHKRSAEKKAKKLLKRIDGVKNSMVTRSKKYNVPCTITVEDLREMALEFYGTTCKYTDRVLTIENMVFDHLKPISKGGDSSKENIQIISRFANNMKGSLEEHDFLILLNWLKTIPDELRKDISIRLAHGIR
jgi:5-methylcytosine-specific restriction endonuclease McrA